MNDISSIHPDDVLKALKAQCNTRMQASLDILHEVCRGQKIGGSGDYSLPTIGSLSQKSGGPSYQTIRNHNIQGDRYRSLIQAWAGFSGGHMKKPVKNNFPQSYIILEKIPDPAVRGILGGIIAENSKLRAENQTLRKNTDIVIDRRPVSALPAVSYNSERTHNLSTSELLTDTELESLKHAIEEKFMKNEGWTIEENGRVKNKNGRSLFKPGFITAIRKVLDFRAKR